ncbi:uncharacterized protein LOC143459273 [Clavelina lepadiformis]|uniref:Uncharacterized protein n=1 Tax=Clavelina lepadiformis TaxID=159417 RepID=A0ABP0GCS5_CLALP
MMKFSIAVLLGIFFCLERDSHACRQEVCRRKRTVEESDVTLQLRGCSGETKPWVRQVAFCLGMSSAEIALKMKDWYSTTYQLCNSNCEIVRAGTKKMNEITTCVNCFKARLVDANFMTSGDVTYDEIVNCLDQYIYAALSNELPSFQAEAEARGRVRLPTVRPENDWWALTVRLPCKPPMFQFWNAYCINSFADDVRAKDFVLSQNRLVFGRNIVFLATFNEVCRFDVSDIQVIWDESIPANAFPQLSSFPTSFPPRRQEHGNIFFNANAFGRLMETDDGFIPELETLNPKRKKRELIARFPQGDILRKIGIIMPCVVKNFEVTDRLGVPISLQNNQNRYLIDPSMLQTAESFVRTSEDTSTLNFTLDFGYSSTGCIFGSNEPFVVPDPPPGWLEGNKQIMCFQCIGASSEEECKRIGKAEQCGAGEACQSEIRRIESDKISITKSCKQSLACQNNQINNNRLQCRPNQTTSVCRCCCFKDYCNSDGSHCT